jgi:proteasome alpha subunit
VSDAYAPGLDLAAALRIAVRSLAGPDRELTPTDLEVAVLERTAERRAFRRLERVELPALLATGD